MAIAIAGWLPSPSLRGMDRLQRRVSTRDQYQHRSFECLPLILSERSESKDRCYRGSLTQHERATYMFEYMCRAGAASDSEPLDDGSSTPDLTSSLEIPPS